MNSTNDKPKVPTLLELALPRKTKTPSTSHSDDSEHDILLGESSLKPPQPNDKRSTLKSEGLKKTIVQPSPNTKRKKFKNKKYEKMIQGFVKDATDETEATSLTTHESEPKGLDTTTAFKIYHHPLSNMTNITGSSGIYSTSNRQFKSDFAKNNQTTEVGQKSRNYHIKVIRRGIPDIVSTDVRGRTIPISTQDVEINPYCVCQNSSSKIRSSLAWMFTFVAAFLCIICPLLSFSADVTFFIICSDHYTETKELLHLVQHGGGQTVVEKIDVPKEQRIAKKQVVVEEQQPAPYRSARETPMLSKQQSFFSFQPILKRQIEKRHTRHNGAKTVNPSVVNVTTVNSLDFTYTTSLNFSVEFATSPPAVNLFNSSLYSDLTDCKIPLYKRKPVCNNASVVLKYMSTEEASLQLEAHRHVTSDVFEPVFIIGSFPSLVLCIFTRLVVMISKHDHFLSAYVINMASMPLQLVTGALAVHSASYHVGQNGFECWKCATVGNCSSIGPLEWLKDGVSVSLIVATIAKLIDGAAGGCILFVVLLRLIWTRKGHVSCWWYISRAIASSLSFVFCVTVSTTMVLTPSVGVFRLEMMSKTAYFHGKETVCYISMVLLGMGLTAWGVSFLSLFIYLMYRTYVYCRIKEHLSDAVSI